MKEPIAIGSRVSVKFHPEGTVVERVGAQYRVIHVDGVTRYWFPYQFIHVSDPPRALRPDGASPANPKTTVGATKPELGVVPHVAIAEASLAFTDGAGKYGYNNYRAGTNVEAMTYVNAISRHLAYFTNGEDRDPDSNNVVHHLGAVIAGASILLQAITDGNLKDDRPPTSPKTCARIRAAAKDVQTLREKNKAHEPKHYYYRWESAADDRVRHTAQEFAFHFRTDHVKTWTGYNWGTAGCMVHYSNRSGEVRRYRGSSDPTLLKVLDTLTAFARTLAAPFKPGDRVRYRKGTTGHSLFQDRERIVHSTFGHDGYGLCVRYADGQRGYDCADVLELVPNAPKFRVGDRVRVLDEGRKHMSSYAVDRAIGRTGTIWEIDNADPILPYQVLVDGGDTWWVHAVELVLE